MQEVQVDESEQVAQLLQVRQYPDVVLVNG